MTSPFKIPTEMAAKYSFNGDSAIVPSATNLSKANFIATIAPVIDAVRVPPSA